ncbi:right-handed parallel beta-helix repeat-containing protein [Engelhardtia mirabilis]|uniref:Uncharacterized protein n=1 Tax=Engelhardtia mirabilis TaxID=2528011 RepID=A0A518BH79_9BACT|nr:hypothetical protein Pla133_13500 [Planctomycetes bacterium Pla133]QDV00609.1 hypothetical protein Pla86_13490 [Planctomycetes bacterium Pla86]
MQPIRPHCAHLLALAVIAAPALGQSVLNVPGQFPTLQSAIDVALDGDTVLVQPGTYNERIDFRGKAIELISAAGAQATIIDGTGAVIDGPPGPDAVVRFDDGETAGSRLTGFTVTGSDSMITSQAVWAMGATPIIQGCVVRDNHASLGGAFSGGGILIDCELVDNVGGAGGAVYGDADLYGCRIAGNLSYYNQGGGVFATGPCTIADCEIVDNLTGFDAYSGGGVAGPASLSYCLVAGNRVQPFGGIPVRGAGLFEPASVDHCTVVDNEILDLPCTGSCEGGGIYGGGPITNSIVRGNVPGQLLLTGAVSYSNVSEPTPGSGNFDADPLFVDAAGGDYHLSSGSPCIDAGDPSAPVDADGTTSDVGTYPLLGVLQSSSFSISVATGGNQSIKIDAGAGFGGGIHVLAGSVSGTSPGLPLGGGLTVPLVPDAYFSLTLAGGAGSPLQNGVGTLDAAGEGSANFSLPVGSAPTLAGLHVDHAGVILDGQFVPALVTNALPLNLLP